MATQLNVDEQLTLDDRAHESVATTQHGSATLERFSLLTRGVSTAVLEQPMLTTIRTRVKTCSPWGSKIPTLGGG